MSQSYRGKNGSPRNYKSSSGRPRKQGRTKIAGVLVVLGLLVVIGVGLLYMMNPSSNNTNGKPGPSATQNSNVNSKDKFAEGVYVDEISLGGLTRSQALQQIQTKQKAYVTGTGVTVTDGTQSQMFKISDTDYTFDTDKVLDQALQDGRDSTDLSKNPVKLTTTVKVNPAKLEQKVRDLAAPYSKPPVNAAYTGYDMTQPPASRLQFSADVPGQQVDADALWASVKQAFESGKFGTVQIQVEPVQASVTVASLQAQMQLITTNPTGTASSDAANVGHTFTTPIKNHTKPRLTNIKLVGDAVSGLVMPGQTLSVNDKTGPRTAAKGYQIAPVDVNGISDIGLGGGACQVSGTLYNASMRYGGKFKSTDTTQPGLTIVERNVHSAPSAYMKLGTDATVDYGSKDLKIRNDFTTPVLILLYYEKDAKGKYWEHCDIYGPPLPDGVSYNLITQLVQTLAPLDGTRTQGTNQVPPGTTVTIPAHKGYVIDVYIEKVASDGTKTDTKIYRDTYRADKAVITYYIKDGEPTDTPSASPTELTPPTDAPTSTPTPPPPTPTPPPTTTPTPADTTTAAT